MKLNAQAIPSLEASEANRDGHFEARWVVCEEAQALCIDNDGMGQ